MTLTGLKQHPRAPDYLVVEIDGARFATLRASVVASLGLVVGQELDKETLARLEHAADAEKAYRRSIRMLTARPRAVNDLLRRLRAKGHNPSAAVEAVGRLEASGVLDDGKFAEHYARTRAERGFGRPRILGDLLAMGVDGRLAERTIDSVLADDDVEPYSRLRELAEKKFGRMTGLPRDTQRRRLYQYLARRGLTGMKVREIVDELVRGSADPLGLSDP